MDKGALRKIFKEKRKQLHRDQVGELSAQISNNFISNLLPQLTISNSTVFSLYLDAYQEVQTAKLAQYFSQHHILFSYPKIIALDNPLQFILHEPDQQFSKSTIFPQIIEPQNGQKVDPDILIVPLLAFDSNFYRLGMGGGFFDRTITHLRQNKNITTIGLAYDFQVLDGTLPHERTDQKLDFIITQSHIFCSNPTVR